MSDAENAPMEPIDVKPELPLVPTEPIDIKPELHLIPTASSDAADTTAPSVYADDIFEGARYRDYHHFRTVLKAFERRTHTAYKNDGSSELKSKDYPDIVEKFKYNYANVKCVHYGHARVRSFEIRTQTAYKKDGSRELKSKDYPDIVEKFKYNHANVKCVHYGHARVRSKGFRQHKNYKAIGCASRMKIHYRPATKDMELTGVFLHHNHVCGPPQHDAKGKELLPEVIGYTPEMLQMLEEFKSGNKRKSSSRPTPYSRPARAPLAPLNQTLPMVSTQNALSSAGESSTPKPAQEEVRKMFKYMNPESEEAQIQKLRAEMMEHLKVINSIPRTNPELRNEIAGKLYPLLQLLQNPYILKQSAALQAVKERMEM
uniref:FLYWCH-type domain-containing protein n=1 Tax=Panagrellus redivivus TaxID=6233 RepID=A0A7E4VJ29_PANRE